MGFQKFMADELLAVESCPSMKESAAIEKRRERQSRTL
jgi:hypothetical protein